MGWIFCLFLNLLIPLQDSHTLREELLAEIDTPTPSGLQTKLTNCLDAKIGIVKILHSAWIQSEKSLKAHHELLQQTEEEMEKHDDTKPGKGGNPLEFIRARARRDEIRKSIALLELYQGRILRGILSRTNEYEENELIRIAKNGPPILRAYSILALGESNRPSASKALLGMIKRERTPMVRVALLRSLSENIEAIHFFEKDLKHPHWQVQLSAARGLARMKDPASAEELITLLSKVTGKVRNEFNKALASITGVDKRGNPSAWKSWWEENKEAFLEGSYTPSIDERAADRGKSTFYGMKIESKRILFLLDVSPSMKRPATWLPEAPIAREQLQGNSLLEVARYELRQMIQTLPKDTLFNVMIFWRDRELALKKPGRGKGDQQTALKFIDQISLQDGTDHWSAFSSAYATYGEARIKSNLPRLDFDTLYLISDGVPSQGIRDPEIFLEKLTDMNRFRNITINTIALEPDGNGSKFLRGIAEKTGGTYQKR